MYESAEKNVEMFHKMVNNLAVVLSFTYDFSILFFVVFQARRRSGIWRDDRRIASCFRRQVSSRTVQKIQAWEEHRWLPHDEYDRDGQDKK